MSRRVTAIAAVNLAFVVGGCPVCPDPLYELITPTPQVRIPLDESPHCLGGVEWWYCTGLLATEAGDAFGIEAVVFHVPAFPLAPPLEYWIAHYAVTDVQERQFRYEQIAIPGPQPPSTSDKPFDLRTPLIHLLGGGGQDFIHAEFADGSYALDLSVTDTRDPVLHGGSGYVPYGAFGRSFHYSRPRMVAEGTLRAGGATLDLSGTMWFERQWGLDQTDPSQRWDWFSLRLDDGTDIMWFEFPGNDGPVAYGTLVPPSGPARPILPDDISIVRSATWLSATTGLEYDVGWSIELPREGIMLTLAAVAEDSEFDARLTTRNIYWEGLCTLEGSVFGQPVRGFAYIEQANGGSSGRQFVPIHRSNRRLPLDRSCLR